VDWTPVEALIERFDFDDVNREHLARHDVRESDIWAVLDGKPLFFPYLPARTATHLMLGPDETQRILLIAILETESPGVWRPVTGWESRQGRAIYARYEAEE
jgi:hypothetical protein